MQNLLLCFVILSNALQLLVLKFVLSIPLTQQSFQIIQVKKKSVHDKHWMLSFIVDLIQGNFSGKTFVFLWWFLPLRIFYRLVFKYTYTHFGVTFISFGRVWGLFVVVVLNSLILPSVMLFMPKDHSLYGRNSTWGSSICCDWWPDRSCVTAVLSS